MGMGQLHSVGWSPPNTWVCGASVETPGLQSHLCSAAMRILPALPLGFDRAPAANRSYLFRAGGDSAKSVFERRP